jgi:nucleotide-binding universal stress UspA family protein
MRRPWPKIARPGQWRKTERKFTNFRHEENAMQKRVLVAVDGTALSNAALSRAIELVADGRSEVRLVHVVDETSVPWDDGGRTQRQHAVAALARAGGRILDEAQAALRGAGRSASSVQLRRDRWPESVGHLIAAEAERWGADLIVIGSRGRGPLRRILRGGVDAAVMRAATTSVLPVTVSSNGRPTSKQHQVPAALASPRTGLA